MGNFLDEGAPDENGAWQGVRIVRCDELSLMQSALSSATGALMGAPPTERVVAALADVREANRLMCALALTTAREPPDEWAERLEKQTLTVHY